MSMVLSGGIMLVQLLALFWLCFGLVRYERIAMLGLRVFAGGCTALALVQLSGATRVAAGSREVRYSVAGTGPNSAAAVMALGALTVVGLLYRGVLPTRSRRLLGWGAFIILGIAIAQTGSRGALVALTAGLLTLLLARGSVLKKLHIILVVVFGLLALLWIVSRSESYTSRWEETLQTGSMAGRERIYPEAWQMFLERPLTGWGPANNIFELGVRTNHRPTRDTHNLLLWILTEVGLLGTVPYCAGLWLCLRGAWKARRGSLGILPLCLAIALLIVNMGITWQFVKIHWFVLAFGAASARPILARSRSTASQRSLSGASALLLEGGMASTRGGAR
jgi:O-antigen ligase